MISEDISLRTIGPADLSFLSRVYATTRVRQMEPIAWEPEQKRDFLRAQFLAQQEHYQRHFPRADFLIVLLGHRAIGRYYLNRADHEFRVIDMALLPAYRNRGIGRALLEQLLKEAAEARLPVRLRVETENPAMRLYRRLGFVPIADEGVNLHMEWKGLEDSAPR